MKKLGAAQVFIAMSFAYGMFSTVVFTISQIYRVITVGLSPIQLVLVGTVLEASVFIFEIPTGVLADIYSRRLSVIIGVFLVGLGMMVEGLAPLFAVVLLSQLVWGFGWTFISGAREAWLADEVGVDAAGALYLRGMQLRQVGSLLGIPLGVFLGKIAYNLPFLVGGGLFLVLGIFLVLFMPENGFQRAPSEQRQTWASLTATLRTGAQLIRSQPTLLTIMAIGLIGGLYSEGYDRLGDAHWIENFAFPSLGLLDMVAWFGVIRAGKIILAIIATGIANRKLDTADNHTLVRALQVINLLIIAGILAFAITGQFVIALVAAWLVAPLRITYNPLETAWVNRHVDSKVRATVLSTFGQVSALGEILGGPFAGAIGTLRSLRAALISAALILLPAVPLLNSTLKHEEP